MIHFFGFSTGSRRTAGKRRASRERGRYRRLGIESLESRQLLSVSWSPAPSAQTVLAGAPLNVALNGSDTAKDAVSYTVSVDSTGLTNPSIASPQLTATVMPSTNPTMTIAVSYAGDPSTGTAAFSGNLVFSLFSNYVSQAVTAITSLINSDFYTNSNFWRVNKSFMAQGGASATNATAPDSDNDYNSNLRFTGPGILAMANGGANTNSSQFFITSPEEASPYAPFSTGDFNYTIIGFLLSGNTTLTDIMNVPVALDPSAPEYSSGVPTKPTVTVTIESVTLSNTDNQDGVLQLNAPVGTTGTAAVTVTATSAADGGASASTTFNVSVGPENYTDPPFIDRPVSPITTSVGTPVDFTIPATDVNGNAITYTATPANSTMTAAAVNSSGQWSLNPSTLSAGVYSVTESVKATSPVGSESTTPDTEDVPVYVDPAAPTGITLVPGSGATSTTFTDLDNTSGKTLEFDVTGVTSGDTVDVYADGTLIGSQSDAQPNASGIVEITTNGTYTLTAGAHSITATQTLEDQTVDVGNLKSTTNLASTDSSALSLTVDTTPPAFNSTPITSATVNVPYSYTATTAADSAGAVTYSLISPAAGMHVNPSTGLLQWTPSSSQAPSVSVDIQATDPAGNTAQQQFTIDVPSTNQPPVLTQGHPSWTIDSNTPLVGPLTSFINNSSSASGSTTISDSTPGAVIGGIAVTGFSGSGTWKYSLDGKTFQTITISDVSATNALLLPKNADIEYIPSGSAGTATATYCAWDTTGGTAGGFADTTASGATAFSSVSDTATINVEATIDDVVLTAAYPSLGSTTATTTTPFTINLSSFINQGSGSGTTAISPTLTGGIAVVGFSGKGTWSFATSVGGTFTAFSALASSPSLSKPLLLGPGAELKYTPDGKDSETPTITYYGWNGTSGTSGTTGSDLTVSGNTGGTTAYSHLTDTASLTVNDAPVLTAANPSLGSTTASTAKTISVSTFINSGSGATLITDSDSNAVLGGIAVTGVTGFGAWAYSLDGTNYTNLGTLSTSAALLLPATADLRYTPNGESEIATITYCAWDQTSGQAGTTADTTSNSGATASSSAFSADSDNAKLAVNDAPVLTAASPSLGSTPANIAQTISLASFINLFSGTTTITDADSNALLGGIALTGTTGKGTWAYELSGQTTFSDVGTVFPDGALLLPSSATLQYTPDGSDAESPTITYCAWDQTSGVAGTTADSTVNGGTTAFSSNDDTATLTVTASNVAPVLAAASPSLGLTGVNAAKTITLASFINNGSGTTTITDSTPDAVIGGIALTGTTGAGTWAYELSGQTSFTDVGSVSASSALLLPEDASLQYTPNGTSESATITYCAWDTTSGTAGEDNVDTTTNGGSTAFSTASDTATLTVGYVSLSGYVYLDPANSGVWTTSSEGLGGVTVRLLLENSSGAFTEVAANSPHQTSASGSYSFSNLVAGTYQIQVTPPPEFVDGQSTPGMIGGAASGTNPQTDVLQVTVSAGQSGTGYNFGVQGVVPGSSVVQGVVPGSSGVLGVVLETFSLGMFFTGNCPITAADLMEYLETAPSVNLAGSLGSTATTDFSTTLSAQGSSVHIAASAASIASPDSPTLVSMTVTLTNPQDGSDEQLQAVTTGTSITSSYDDTTGVLSLTGVADTSTYQTVLQSITYSDASTSPTSGDRTINVVVDDGTLSSDTAVSTIDVLPTGSGATTTALTSADSTVVFGQSVTLTATVSPSSGSATPTGTVTFTNSGTTLGTGTLTGGVATLSTAALAEGSDTVTASYGGDSTYSPSSGTLTETVNQAAAATALSASPNPAVYGQAVMLTATVSASSPGAGTPTGTVSFTGSDGTSLGTETLSSGVATLTTSELPEGSQTITVSYSGDSDFTSGSGSGTETINQADTTTVLSAPSGSAVSGQPVTFTATVSATSPGSGTPTGTVTFSDDSTTPATTLGMYTLTASDNGVATVTTTTLPVGSQTITASYAGDTNFDGSPSSSVSVQVLAATNTTLTSSANPAVTGQYVTFTAAVAPATGSGVPAGTVNFYDNGNLLGPVTLNSSGVATFPTATLAQGDQITAVYQGDSNFATSTSNAITETVSPAGDATSDTVLDVSPNPAAVGQSVTLTATVSDPTGEGTPTGTVTFLNGTTVLDTETVDPSIGAATFTTSTLPVGTYTFYADYSGDTSYAPSGGTTTETVQLGTTTTLSASPSSPVYGQSVTVTATVSDPTDAGTPTGTVSFTDSDGDTLGTENLVPGATGTATATVSTSTLPLGSDLIITASYSGDTSYAPSSGTTTETVLLGTTTTLGASPSSPVYGQSVTVTATVSDPTDAGTPTGTVTFTNSDGTNLGTGTLVPGATGTATATINTSALPAGNDTVTASYSGDTTYAAGSGTLPETISQAGTTTTLASSANPALTGQWVTFTATVSASSPGSGTPTGQVDFYDNGILVGTETLNSSGVAPFSMSTLAQGDQITAAYQGDSNFTGSPLSSAITETVNPVGATVTKTTVTPVPNPGTVGQSVTFAATVQDTTDAGLPTGTVTFLLNGTTVLDTETLDTAGLSPSVGSLAVFTTSTLSAGDYSITAVYSGNSTTYALSTSVPVSEVINEG